MGTKLSGRRKTRNNVSWTHNKHQALDTRVSGSQQSRPMVHIVDTTCNCFGSVCLQSNHQSISCLEKPNCTPTFVSSCRLKKYKLATDSVRGIIAPSPTPLPRRLPRAAPCTPSPQRALYSCLASTCPCSWFAAKTTAIPKPRELHTGQRTSCTAKEHLLTLFLAARFHNTQLELVLRLVYTLRVPGAPASLLTLLVKRRRQPAPSCYLAFTMSTRKIDIQTCLWGMLQCIIPRSCQGLNCKIERLGCKPIGWWARSRVQGSDLSAGNA